MKKPVIVYVAWGRDVSDQLNEKGKVALSKVALSKLSKYEFETQGEANAFCKGIDEANGWDEPMWVKESGARIEKKTLHLK
jgi:hypothetical protein